jgi:hypothetical protein
MGLFKKNPVFCTVCAVAVLVFLGGTALVVMESGKLSKSKQLVDNADSQINSLLNANPAPTDDNVKAAQKNAEELIAQLRSIRENLQRGSRLTVSSDGVRVMSGLQKYISHYRQEVADRRNEKGEPDPIIVPNDFAFGFEKYREQTTISDDSAIVPELDKQRQILSYILNQLIAAEPIGIQSVERESLGVVTEKGDTAFKINPAISARVPDAIDTLAFRITFTGYTPTLRKFLNNLERFDLPVVVRSVDVDRLETSTKTTAAKNKKPNGLEAIFGGFSGGTTAEKTETSEPKVSGTPVISETESSFTVTLEFIEIILPSESEENPS